MKYIKLGVVSLVCIAVLMGCQSENKQQSEPIKEKKEQHVKKETNEKETKEISIKEESSSGEEQIYTIDEVMKGLRISAKDSIDSRPITEKDLFYAKEAVAQVSYTLQVEKDQISLYQGKSEQDAMQMKKSLETQLELVNMVQIPRIYVIKNIVVLYNANRADYPLEKHILEFSKQK